MDMAWAKGQKRIGRRPRKSWPEAKNALAEGQSPPQELEVRPRSVLYLLVYIYLFIYISPPHAILPGEPRRSQESKAVCHWPSYHMIRSRPLIGPPHPGFFPGFSWGFSGVSPGFSRGFPKVFLGFSRGFPGAFPGFSQGFPRLFP